MGGGDSPRTALATGTRHERHGVVIAAPARARALSLSLSVSQVLSVSLSLSRCH